MLRKKEFVLFLGILTLLLVVVAACQSEPTEVEVTRIVELPGETVEVEVPGPEVEVTRVVEVPAEVEMAVSVVPFEEEWASSPHNDSTAEAFIHWDEDGEIQESCAKCHSTPGFMDFIGADGSEAGVVNAPAALGTTVECAACHNDVTQNMTSVVMPSGIELMGLGDESRCMQCHQGRHSTVSVNAGIEEAGLSDPADADTVSEDLGFSNIHYYAAAATQFGTMAKGGYEYDGKTYDSRFDHVEGFNTCVDCHDSHTLEVQFDDCTQCHEGLNSVEDLATVRMAGSLVDYNGNGDMEEGIEAEIAGLRDMLYEALQAYASEVSGTPIVYDASSHPYFFDDAGERFAAWTPRLAKAAYNYQVSQKDPGNFAHGGKYTIQLLYDSIEDLNQALSTPVDLSMAHRIDHGHFAGSEEAFRHWDEDGAVPGSCSKCHSAAGLPLFITEGVSITQPHSNGLNCSTCHDNVQEYTRYVSESVTFPSGLTASLAVDETDTAGLESNLCMNCHQGRSSVNSVNAMIEGLPDDEVSDAVGFTNIHYFAAGASLLGDEAQGAYQFEGKEYVGRNEHVGRFNSCTECHDTHALEVVVEDCAECHEGVEVQADLINIRGEETPDYDGDGDTEEGIAGEIETMKAALLAAMQEYANTNAGTAPIVYGAHAYPYFFLDTNEDGEASPDEAIFPNQYNTWTPRLARAAYNYQFASKDPGVFAHNGPYMVQVLYDALEDIGADVSGMTRP
ncbi:MAG: cytochrome c3 family protein [Candidatus Promineifilaceae bacterium]|nr:cytochrome c3 family protein [Candidatus Promineifilaceae bacterium]